MRKFAEYVMKSRWHAAILALLFNFIPLLGWVSDVIVALVTLRKGAKEGGIILMWAILPSVIFALMGYPSVWFYNILGGSLIVYAVALVLRRTSSWTLVLEIVAVLGVIAVALVHILVPDILHRITQEILNFYNNYKGFLGADLEPAAIQQMAILFAKFAIGAQVVLLLVIDLFNVLIARWLQALLYHPKGFHVELQNIRVGLVSVIMLLISLVGACLGWPLAIDILPVVLLPFTVAGISLAHDLVRLNHLSKFWLIGFYALLILLFIYFIGILVAFVLADYWLNFRGRFCRLS